MIATVELPPHSAPRTAPTPARPPLPREHGAWGILLIPFAAAVAVAGVWNLPVALLLVSILCFYAARTSYLREVGPGLRIAAAGGRVGRAKWTLSLLAASAACAAPLVLVWQLWWLAAFGAAGVALGFRKTERGLVMQLLAVAGLTLTAPAAWYAVTGDLGWPAWRLWLLNALYFAGGVFYVKMHIAAAIRRGDDRLRLGAPTLSYYAIAGLCLVGLALAGLIPWLVILAFVPVAARAVVGVWRLSPILRIKRLGWTEVAYSLVFLILSTATRRAW